MNFVEGVFGVVPRQRRLCSTDASSVSVCLCARGRVPGAGLRSQRVVLGNRGACPEAAANVCGGANEHLQSVAGAREGLRTALLGTRHIVWAAVCACIIRSLSIRVVTAAYELRQVTLAVMISGWAHVLHAVFKPWGTASITYKLQHLSLFTTTFVFLLGLLFKANGVDAKDTTFG